MEYRLGMVLSGGGARGLGHVGILKALSEEGIEPDCLAGSSAGAIVAALYAAGYAADEMLEFFVDKNPFRLSKLSLAKPGIFDTEKVVADFQEYFPDDSFEALQKKIYITATDLVEGRLEIFATGRLIPPILASASTPLVFTPTEIDGRWYSDGGIINNFPVEPLQGHCDVLLGAYVSPLPSLEQSQLRTSFAVSQRALDIGMYFNSRRKFHEVDLLIAPAELARYGAFDTKHFAEIMQVGYRAAKAAMPRIREVVQRLGPPLAARTSR